MLEASEASYKCSTGTNPLKSICTDTDCKHNGFMCDVEDCKCQSSHVMHERITKKGFELRLADAPVINKEHQEMEKMMDEMFDITIADLQKCRDRHRLHLASHYHQFSLKDKFLAKENVQEQELTGANIKRMLNELKPGVKTQCPYQLKPFELKKELESISSHFKRYLNNIEQLWSIPKRLEQMTEEEKIVQRDSIKFEDQILKEADFLESSMPVSSRGLIMKNCKSDEWPKIVQRLSYCKHMEVIDVYSCNIGDELCVVAGQMKKLREVRFESCKISEEGAREFLNLPSLMELNLDGNHKLTQKVFLEILSKLNGLQTLNLHLYSVKDITYPDCEGRSNIARFIVSNMKNLSRLTIRNPGREGLRIIAEQALNLTSLSITHSGLTNHEAEIIATGLKNLTELDLTNNNVGKVGAEHIACNLRSLDTLKISENNIGSEGAEHIANNLRNLKTLYINGNNIGSEGAEAIGKNLKSLTHLVANYNNIGMAGAKAIFTLPAVTTLNISNNMIPQELLNPVITRFNSHRHLGWSITT